MTDYLEELGKKQHEKNLYKDSQSVIQLVKNPVYHLKTKHKRQYHFTRRLVEDGDVLVEDGDLFGEDRECKKSNMLTKCVDVGILRLCKASIGIVH